jgi:hypothetical protein
MEGSLFRRWTRDRDLSEGAKKSRTFDPGPFRMALFPEIWNAGRHRLGNPPEEWADERTAIGSAEFDVERYGPKVLQENHPCGPGLILADFLIFHS